MIKKLKPEEQYILDVCPEIGVGQASGWIGRIFSVFPAFQSRNYRLYFIGQFISVSGTWLQIVAQGWLVLQITHSAFLIGLVAAMATLPMLLFSLFGGVIVDRFPKRNILIFTQSAAMILAFVFGFLTIFKIINVFEIAILAFLLGIVTAVDAPARQAFVVEMVGKELLGSAIALNSGIFNSARVIGPSIAGILIATVGIGGAFIINGVSYMAVILALLLIQVKPAFPRKHPHPLKAIKEGIAYSFSHPIIRTLLIFTAVTSVFGWSFTTIMPLIAYDTFHLGASGLGYLYAAGGLGALVATLLVSAFSKKITASIFILGGSVLFALAITIFTFTTHLEVALPLLFLSGIGLLAQFLMMNTTIQNLVKDELRGRVMSLYTLMFMGLSPFGSLEVGFFAEHFGANFAIRLGAIIILVFSVLIYLVRNKIEEAHRQYVLQ